MWQAQQLKMPRPNRVKYQFNLIRLLTFSGLSFVSYGRNKQKGIEHVCV